MELRLTLITTCFLCSCLFAVFVKQVYSKAAKAENSFNDLIDVIEKEILHEEEDFTAKSCVCGEGNTPLSARVIGGEDVEAAGKYPWMVTLLMKVSLTRYYSFCGAAIISERYVITAAHCVARISPKRKRNIRLNVGIHRLPILSQTFKGSKYIFHPDYAPMHEHDLALIKLAEPLKFSDTVRPICLPANNSFPEPKEVVIAGWGLTTNPELYIEYSVFDQLDNFFRTRRSRRQGLNALQTATLPIVPNTVCQEKYEGEKNITDFMICSVGKGKGACFGDSGSSLISEYKGRWYSVGVVSGGKECASEAYPGIYNRVSHHLDWILKNTKDAPPCVPE